MWTFTAPLLAILFTIVSLRFIHKRFSNAKTVAKDHVLIFRSLISVPTMFPSKTVKIIQLKIHMLFWPTGIPEMPKYSKATPQNSHVIKLFSPLLLCFNFSFWGHALTAKQNSSKEWVITKIFGWKKFRLVFSEKWQIRLLTLSSLPFFMKLILLRPHVSLELR